ncbi:AEC family transporter [Virgibacillus halophilus]|uniref:AEC family transporter n=1 Tax=Tigheibacillus halophilus TaxID=361280 RepID=A0ABU5C9B7_9BACI|nr:AEC family transporter [Virgibacillus halophilus]
MSTNAFLQAMVPLYIISLVGLVSRRMKILPQHANQVITQLMLYITLPALILFSLHAKLTVELMADFAWMVTMSIFILSVSVFAGAWLRKKAALPWKQKSVYESLIIFGNQGFIGFAVSYMLIAEQGIIYLTLFNICYLILIWTYGIYLFTRNEQSVNWRGLFFNPGILSTLIGLGMLFLPFSWPAPILNTFESLGKVTIPLSMILIGSMLADIQREDLWKYSKNVYLWMAAGCKLLFLPLFLLIFLLFHVSYPLIIIAVMTSAMPSASTTSVYAQKFGGDAVFASFGVILTTLLCTFTIPLLYSLLHWLRPFFL